MAVQHDDGPPTARLPTAIDAIRLRPHFQKQVGVALDLHAARCADLHEREPPAVFRVILQQRLDAPQTLQNALSVVHAIHAHTKKVGLNAEFFTESLALLSSIAALPTFGLFRKRNTDRERMHQRLMVAAVYGKPLEFHARLQRAIHGLQEVDAMRLDMKADQVRAEQSMEDLPLLRTNTEGFGIGPRDMPENRDPRVRPLFLDHAWSEREMVILNQHDRLRGVRHFLENGARDLLIDAPVLFPVPGTK